MRRIAAAALRPLSTPVRRFRTETRAQRWLLRWLTALLLLVGSSVGLARAEDAAQALPGVSAGSTDRPGDMPKLGAAPADVSVPAGFSTYDGGWIRFAYHPSLRARLQPLIADANDVRAELGERLGGSTIQHVRVHVARTPGEMKGLAPRGAPYPEYAAGVAYSELGLVLLTATPLEAGEHHDLSEVFRHELAHIALHEAVKGRSIPRWFNEGFAVFASGEGSLVRLQTLWTATVAGHLIPMRKLERTFPADGATASVAYAQAADFVRFMVRREDRHRFSGLIERLKRGLSFDQALTESYEARLETLELEWRDDVGKRYTFWPLLLGGSFFWVALLGLFFLGYRRKRKESKLTLARWAKEESLHDEMQQLRAAQRVQIVIAPAAAQADPFMPVMEPDVPKVEHDGGWHTLH